MFLYSFIYNYPTQRKKPAIKEILPDFRKNCLIFREKSLNFGKNIHKRGKMLHFREKCLNLREKILSNREKCPKIGKMPKFKHFGYKIKQKNQKHLDRFPFDISRFFLYLGNNTLTIRDNLPNFGRIGTIVA